MPFPISEILDKDMPFIRIVDVGAMFLGVDNFDKLVQQGHAQVIGFDPQKEECEKLNARALAEAPRADQVRRQYFPYFIGDGSRRKFYFTNTGYTSSLYEPDQDLAQHFENLSEVCKVNRVEEVQTTRLDDIPELGKVDSLKMHLDHLSARQRLAMAVVLHEVYLSYDLVAFILGVHDQIAKMRYKDFYLAKMFAALNVS